MDGTPYWTEEWYKMMDLLFLKGNGMRLLYKMYITCDLVPYEPTCAIWENIAFGCASCYIIPYSTHRLK